MGSFVVEGGHKLSGTIRPQGAKNEALEVISAVLLTDEEVIISNVPEILDVKNLILLLEGMGVKISRLDKGVYSFKADNVDTEYIASADFVAKCAQLRGSVMVVGPLLARFGRAYFPKPGGDKIGRRRVDTHILGMMNLGATQDYDSSKKAFYLHVPQGGCLKGCYMLLDEKHCYFQYTFFLNHLEIFYTQVENNFLEYTINLHLNILYQSFLMCNLALLH